jgi:hypothetical protein
LLRRGVYEPNSSTRNVEAIAAVEFEQVAPLRRPDSFTTFLTEFLKEVRKQNLIQRGFGVGKT